MTLSARGSLNGHDSGALTCRHTSTTPRCLITLPMSAKPCGSERTQVQAQADSAARAAGLAFFILLADVDVSLTSDQVLLIA